MNACYLASDLARLLCRALKAEIDHGRGLSLTPHELVVLHRSLRSIEEISRETEEENRILEHRLAALRDERRNRRGRAVDLGPDGKVVRLPCRARPRTAGVIDPDGGDAA